MVKNIIFLLFIFLFCSFLVYFFVYSTNLQIKHKPNIKIVSVTNISPTPTPTEPTITPLTLDSIFKGRDEAHPLDKNNLVTIAVTGDFIPSRSVNYQTLKYNNFLWSVEEIKSYFTRADIVFVNLEAPIFANCPVTNEGFVFCGEEKHVNALTSINTTIVNLSNNHLSNYGEEGYTKTKEILQDNNIQTIGDKLTIIEKKGIKFAFLGYNDIGYTPNYLYKVDLDKIKNDILQAKNTADIVIVQFHFGSEYADFPDRQQVKIAQSAIDFGADLVVGNHPHSIQPVEIYKDKVIMYAHGNFVFDQMWSEQTKQGVVGFYTFYKKTLVKVEFKPVYITDYGKATIPNNTTGTEIINKLKTNSYTWKIKNNF